MALQLISVIPKARGAVVLVRDPDEGYRRGLWRKGFVPKKYDDQGQEVPTKFGETLSKSDLRASQINEILTWAQPHYTGSIAPQKQDAIRKVVAEAEIDTDSFFDWIKNNRDRKDVRECLRELRRLRSGD